MSYGTVGSYTGCCRMENGIELVLSAETWNRTARLIPVLVSCTVYSQDQIAEFESMPQVDEHIPDAPEDIRPMFHRSKSGGEAAERIRRDDRFAHVGWLLWLLFLAEKSGEEKRILVVHVVHTDIQSVAGKIVCCAL